MAKTLNGYAIDHFVLSQIQQCYTELDKFWIEEIRREVKALEMRRLEPTDTDFEGWKGFHASLEQTIESWWMVWSLVLIYCSPIKIRCTDRATKR